MKRYYILTVLLIVVSAALFGQHDAPDEDIFVQDDDFFQTAAGDYQDTSADGLYIFAKHKSGYRYRIGVGNEFHVVYYRRSFGLGYDIFANVRIVRGLNFEGGVKTLIYSYSLSHFYPITVNYWDNAIHGSFFGAKAALKYHFDILEHFGLLIGSGVSVGAGFYSCKDYMRSQEVVSCVGLEILPEWSVGATIPFGRYRIDVNCTKWLPVIPINYNYANKDWMTYEDYNRYGKYNSPMRPICWSAMGISVSITYFLK